ncbi:MAG: hypothetical protein Q8M03_09990 [Legionella sp.]|nr:hypothetical protein [Legionella sp.]
MMLLKQVLNDIPQLDIHLCKLNRQNQIKHEVIVRRALSDHDPIIGSNQHGIFASWNLLNPDSPVSPGFNPEGFKGIYMLYYEEERLQHMQLLAEVLVKLLEQGVEAIALQEVPAMNSVYFKTFWEALHSMANEKQLAIDFDAFVQSYSLTRRKDQDYNKFGTALLMRAKSFKLKEITPILYERGADYLLYSLKSNKALHLINIHADYEKSEILAEFLMEKTNALDTLIMGDTNIALSKKEILKTIATMKGYCFTPSCNHPDTDESSLTLDCLLTRDKTQFVTRGMPVNFADEGF